MNPPHCKGHHLHGWAMELASCSHLRLLSYSTHNGYLLMVSWHTSKNTKEKRQNLFSNSSIEFPLTFFQKDFQHCSWGLFFQSCFNQNSFKVFWLHVNSCKRFLFCSVSTHASGNITGKSFSFSSTSPSAFLTLTTVATCTGCGEDMPPKKALTKSLWQFCLAKPLPPSLARVWRSCPLAPLITAAAAYCCTSQALILPQQNLLSSMIAKGEVSCISSPGSGTCFLFFPCIFAMFSLGLMPAWSPPASRAVQPLKTSWLSSHHTQKETCGYPATTARNKSFGYPANKKIPAYSYGYHSPIFFISQKLPMEIHSRSISN